MSGRIEGGLNVFRSRGFTSMRGFENLETVDGDLAIHMNRNLTSLAALGKLRTITGDLFIFDNDALPQTDVEAFAAGVVVGGQRVLKQVAP